MVFEQIENKKREYTDKYVVVDPSRPELARFKDTVGQVKTVNMSGRALVEFMDYHLNTGWYDIDPEFLKVVDKPPPKVEKPVAKKPAAKAEAKPAAAAKPPAAAKPAAVATGGKQSVADILAAARAGKAAAPKPAGEAAAATGTPKTQAAPAAPKPPAAAKPAAVDRSKMSVAEMLAAARTGGAPGAPAAKPQAAPSAAKTPAPAAPVDAAAAVEEPVEDTAPAASPAKSSEKIDKSKMTSDDIIAWCRQYDAK